MSPSASPSRFWDKRAAQYARKPVPDEEAYARTLARVRSHLGSSDRVLELGCGTGTTALKLAADVREMVAVDYSAEMIGIATAKSRSEGATNVRFLTCTTDDEALGSSFDVVLAMNLLHLIRDVPAELGKIHALVRPGGLFISKTPCVGDQGLAVRLVVPVLRAIGQAPYVNFVTEQALSADITAAGFEVRETGMYPRKSRSFFVVAKRAEIPA